MFMAPLFLIAGAAGAMIPLILHLLQKRKVVTQEFPTLRFLKMAEQRSSQRIRLENLLLWILRTLIMLLLGMAFAMPILRARGMGFLGRAARDVAVIIDASYSMSYMAGRQTIWDRAMETASEIINGLEPNDRISLFLAKENAEALIAEPIGDHERALAQLDGLTPEYDTSRLAAALSTACDALMSVPQRREREVHILTDNQALAWEDFIRESKDEKPADSDDESDVGEGTGARATERWDPDSIDQRTAFFVSMLGVASPVNIAPMDITLSPPFMFPGVSARLSVLIGCSGDTPETTVSLYINDREMARRSVSTAGEKSVETSFVIPPMPVGLHTGRIETPDDNLPVDNVFYFMIRVVDQLPTLCVGSERDTIFLRTALRAGSSGKDPFWITPEELAGERNLGAYSCVFLVNALPLPGQIIADIERYVADGGTIVIFPGSRGSPDDYRAWDCLPGTPYEITTLPSGERSLTLAWTQPRHILIQQFHESLAIPRLSIQRSLSWNQTHPQAVTLISAGPERPFLLQRDYGRGSVLMFAISADRGWSNFPLSPFYLPMIMQIIEYSAGVGAQAPFIWCRDLVPLHELIPGADADTVILDPTGRRMQVRSMSHATRSIVHSLALRLPGIYQTTPQGGSGPSVPAFAANFPRRESDLTPIDPDRIPEILGVDNLYIASDQEALRQAIQEHRVGRTYGEHLLLLALILMGMEFFYANMLSRKKPDLSSRLGLTSSGKLGGRP